MLRVGRPSRRHITVLSLLVLSMAGAGLAVQLSRPSSGPAAVLAAKPATAVRVPPPVFPLRIGPTGRYLVDRTGHPFLIVGDSPEALIGDLSEANAARYFADREAAGFNSVWVNLLCDSYTGCRAGGATYDGIPPFTIAGDVSTPDPAYFNRAGTMIRLAAEHHLAVFLDPIETGGWLKVLRLNGLTKDYEYGRYLGRRYRQFSNVVWLNGNDFQKWKNARDDKLALAVARGIKSADPGALQTVELNFLKSTSLDDQRWKGIIGLDEVYTYFPTYAEVRKAYSASDHLPVFMGEASYEGEHEYTGPETLRRQEYWSILSGASGQFYGEHYTWQFLRGWSSHLDTIGSRQLTFVTNLFARRDWYDLVPDSHLLVAGYGSYAVRGNPNSSDYATAARTSDGRLAIAYLPSARPIKVDLAQMAGSRVNAQWFDPTSGRYETVHGSPFPPRGTRSFAMPGRNSAGDTDWVLVLTTGASSAANAVPER